MFAGGLRSGGDSHWDRSWLRYRELQEVYPGAYFDGLWHDLESKLGSRDIGIWLF
ncbi:MAG: hypothetical protein VYA34_05075 [Myxococcota bacterium]|nr:hypothetical protein [Myxococcota bacterium]